MSYDLNINDLVATLEHQFDECSQCEALTVNETSPSFMYDINGSPIYPITAAEPLSDRLNDLPTALAEPLSFKGNIIATNPVDEEEEEQTQLTNYAYERIVSMLDAQYRHDVSCSGPNPVILITGILLCFASIAVVVFYTYYLDVTFAKMNHTPLPGYLDNNGGDSDGHVAMFIYIIYYLFELVTAYALLRYTLFRQVFDGYKREGREIRAKIIHREIVETRDSNNETILNYVVVVLYEPNPFDQSTLYAKRLFVHSSEYENLTLPLVVLPEIPSSARLKRNLDDGNNCQCIIAAITISATPLLWYVLLQYAKGWDAFNDSYFWSNFGIWGLFLISWTSSFMLMHSSLAEDVKSMLHGQSVQVPLYLLGSSNCYGSLSPVPMQQIERV